MEETIEKIIYNRKEYVLVNDDFVNGKKVYHFLSVELLDFINNYEKNIISDGKSFPEFNLFCTKSNDRFIPIKDENELIILLGHFGMLPKFILASIEEMFTPEDIELLQDFAKVLGTVYMTKMAAVMPKLLRVREYNQSIDASKVSEKAIQEFIEEQKKNFEDINQKLGGKLDLAAINKKLEHIIVNTCNIEKYQKLYKSPNVAAFYSGLTENVYFPKETLGEASDDIESKRNKLHETIHYLAGKYYAIMNRHSNLVIEGGTENVVEEYFKDEDSSSVIEFYDKDGNLNGSIRYNLSPYCAYKPYVSLVKQLEYITGVKSIDSAINGKMDFAKSIISEFGLYSLTLFAETNKMMKINDIEQDEITHKDNIEFLKKFEEIEDKILQISFDKRFKKINSLEDAQKYLEFLKGFETYRAQIAYMENEEIKINSTFEKYYKDKYNQLLERFKENEELLKKYEYKPEEQNFLKSILEEVHNAELDNLLSQYYGDVDKIPRKKEVTLHLKGESYYLENEGDFRWRLDYVDTLQKKKIQAENPEMSAMDVIKKIFEEKEHNIEKVEINFSEEELEEKTKRYEKPIRELKDENINSRIIDKLLKKHYGDISGIPQNIKISIHKKGGSYYIEGLDEPFFLSGFSLMDIYRIRKLDEEEPEAKTEEKVRKFFAENGETVETRDIVLTKAEILAEYEKEEEEILPYWFRDIKSTLEINIIENFDGDFEKIPTSQKVEVLRLRSEFIITKIDEKETECPPEVDYEFLQDYKDYSLDEDAELTEREWAIKYLQEMGGEEEKFEVTFNREQLIKKCKEKEEKAKTKKINKVEQLLLKPITFGDKIKNKIRKLFGKKKTGDTEIDNEPTNESRRTKNINERTSWKLENWGKGTKEKVAKKQREAIEKDAQKTKNEENTLQKDDGETIK